MLFLFVSVSQVQDHHRPCSLAFNLGEILVDDVILEKVKELSDFSVETRQRFSWQAHLIRLELVFSFFFFMNTVSQAHTGKARAGSGEVRSADIGHDRVGLCPLVDGRWCLQEPTRTHASQLPH